MKTKKICGIYIGELLFGTVVMGILISMLMVAANSVVPAWN